MLNQTWLAKLQKLHPSVSKAKGAGNARFAPHKPLLLLCLIDLAKGGALTTPLVDKSPELRLRFDCYWGIVQGRWGGRPGFDLPFHYLSSQGFWTPLREDGERSEAESTTTRIRLEDEFFECMGDVEFRKEARFLLVRGVRHKLLIFNYFKHVFEYRECNKWQRILRTGLGGVAVESSL